MTGETDAANETNTTARQDGQGKTKKTDRLEATNKPDEANKIDKAVEADKTVKTHKMMIKISEQQQGELE